MSSKIIVLASSNAGKAREFAALIHPLGYELHLQKEYGVTDVAEDGLSFVENALIKARHAAKLSGLPALADDSGICVAALKGAPGIMSARFAGVHGDDVANNEKLLSLLAPYTQFEQRRASYVCALALVRHAADPLPLIAIATWDGYIGKEALGSGGFGYDPLFIVEGRGLTAAQLPESVKNLISHRARALRKLTVLLEQDPLE
ncbi:MAG: RdgB/HAM1 family non-canonical purine NTP pyrophosphatase [Candidatus Anaerobiospirillum merdipullorum]|uniref:dITP/XTP pyrophosphatase n=1 Tax=Candidatus Anaerobiospirillum merdipullorum TaxID=2838450 RepID=A0A9E2NRT9_9GAMM|nr:RdgB/HAM1 family non-canonical purine NTP pyrophosphatase [Candidatus Anaerobiospirillum merdipullorum]